MKIHAENGLGLTLVLAALVPYLSALREVEAAPGQFQFTDEQATNSARRFYRIRSP